MATIEEKRNQKILEESIDNLKPKNEAQSKSEKGVADTVFAEYADRFFADIKSDGKKMTISINASTMQLVKNVLFYLQENTAMATYIENILLSHFSEYRDLLNEEVSARVKPQIIPDSF